jgi:5-methylcytosine-specific restriction endonuclease McrA
MTGRSVPEWIGSSPDAKVPTKVKIRVFEAHNGICALSGIKITPGMEWDLDHKKRLKDGGEHRESNLQPALRDKHRKKTAEENRVGAKTTRMMKKHLGLKQSKNPMPGSRASKWKRPMNGPPQRRES